MSTCGPLAISFLLQAFIQVSCPNCWVKEPKPVDLLHAQIFFSMPWSPSPRLYDSVNNEILMQGTLLFTHYSYSRLLVEVSDSNISDGGATIHRATQEISLN